MREGSYMPLWARWRKSSTNNEMLRHPTLELLGGWLGSRLSELRKKGPSNFEGCSALQETGCMELAVFQVHPGFKEGKPSLILRVLVAGSLVGPPWLLSLASYPFSLCYKEGQAHLQQVLISSFSWLTQQQVDGNVPKVQSAKRLLHQRWGTRSGEPEFALKEDLIG